MATSFLPQNYTRPTTAGAGDYTKLQDGTNSLRILSQTFLVGYVYWNKDGKPVRSEQHPGQPADARVGQDGKAEKAKEFWATAVYNIAAGKVEIWEITQGQIKDALESLGNDAEWGHPSQYSIKVMKSGKGLETKYAVMPSAPKPLPADVQAVVDASPVNLRSLFGDSHPAPGATPTAEQSKVLADVSDESLPF